MDPQTDIIPYRTSLQHKVCPRTPVAWILSTAHLLILKVNLLHQNIAAQFLFQKIIIVISTIPLFWTVTNIYKFILIFRKREASTSVYFLLCNFETTRWQP